MKQPNNKLSMKKIFFAGWIALTLNTGLSAALPEYSTQHYSSGDWYKGPLINGRKNGRGIYGWANGDHYEGDFINDQFTGKGVLTWANGNQYKGDFINGKPLGQGVFIWANGDYYQGDFVENHDLFNSEKGDSKSKIATDKNKSGVMLFANGHRQQGIMVKGQFHALGK